MDTLFDALYSYATAHRIDLCLKPDEGELRDTQWMRDRALSDLRAMDARGADLAERLEFTQDTLLYLHRRAAFQAGLSIGLELGALGHGV